MKYSDNAINILTTLTFKGIGRAWIVKNLGFECFDAESIISLINNSPQIKERITVEIFEEKKEHILRVIHNNEPYIDGIVAIGDPEFPQHRGLVKNSDQPVFLFYRGNISLLNKNNRNIAVIGLLNPDTEIENIEKKVISALVEKNITIISGLALGCDTVAHEQTLLCGGKTVAILPSPLRSVLPSSNRTLADIIVKKGGLLISEYITDAKSKNMLSSRYQERDRLQALFSDGIILSASYAKNDQGNDSGSRLAMQYAKEYKIQRALIYDEYFANNPKFDLNRQYLNEDSSITVIDGLSISARLNDMFFKTKSNSQPSLFDFEL